MVGSGEALLVLLLQVGDLHPAGEAGKKEFVNLFSDSKYCGNLKSIPRACAGQQGDAGLQDVGHGCSVVAAAWRSWH